MFHDPNASDTHGVNGCKAGCILCKDYLKTGKSIQLKNGKTIKANSKFDCLSKNLLYTAICSGCNEFYTGETGDHLSTRFTVHRQQAKADAQIQAVSADQHFRVCGRNKYAVYQYYRLKKKNCQIYRRIVEDYHIKTLEPLLNGKPRSAS